MKLVYIYDDNSEISVTGKSEKECAEKIRKAGADKKKAEGRKIVRINRPRTMMEIVTSR
jgi:hypothetical protein